MRHPLLPRAASACSRRWSFWVNSVAASPYVRRGRRLAIYRRLGLDIGPGVEIGARCYIHSSAFSLGEGSFINGFCWFENVAPVRIGRGVAVGPRVTVITSSHHIGGTSARAGGGWYYLPVTVQDGAWIGAGALIQPGVTIGHGCVIAAGAVVTSDTEPDWLYGGVPARKIRPLDADGDRRALHAVPVADPQAMA